MVKIYKNYPITTPLYITFKQKYITFVAFLADLLYNKFKITVGREKHCEYKQRTEHEPDEQA